MHKTFTFPLAALLLAVLLPAPQARAQTAGEKLQFRTARIERYNFSNVDKDAQMWSGVYIASNNKIYIGLCTHADAANVYEFDIDSRGMRHLANLTILLDERGRGIWTNGKIHVQMQELDGYVYFGSFCEDNGPPAIDANSYRGPHWFRIEMSSGRVEPLSRINSFWGLTGQTMDKQRRTIYGLCEDGHLCRYFVDRDYTEDMGRVDSWDICRTIFTDDAGNVYGSYPPGNIWKYNPVADRIWDLEYLKLPIINVSRTMANPMLDRKAQWRIIEWDPKDKAAYGIVGGSNVLFRYDVHAGKEGEITPLAVMCAPQYRDGDPYEIPHATLAMTISQPERKIYYIPVISGDFDYGAVELDVAGEQKFGSEIGEHRRMPPLSYMVSYDLTTSEREDIGLLRTADGSYAYGMEGAETDSQGRIWFVGAFEQPDSAFVVGRMSRRFSYSMGLGCYDPHAQN
jgi:hypothetical protein